MNFTILSPVLSNNELLRMHFRRRKVWLENYEKEIVVAIGSLFLDLQMKRRIVKIISYRKKLLDEDNLVGGAKLLIDALKRLGLIHDDSPAWIDLDISQMIDSKNPRTEISIDEKEATDE